jgi:antitoxin YefM
MFTETTYTQARARLASLCDRVGADRDVVIIKRRGAQDVALIAADELSSITETAHLLRSPRNAARLQRAMKRARKRSLKPQTVAKLLKEIKFDPEN